MPSEYEPFSENTLRVFLADGWTIQSDGPTGVQLVGKKKPAMSTRIVLILGMVLLLAYGFGLILIILALADYARTPKPTIFLSRSNNQRRSRGEKDAAWRKAQEESQKIE
jgi:hypothetical protein